MAETMIGEYRVTLPEGSKPRSDGTSTCPKTHGGTGQHFWLRNQAGDGFACYCGATAKRHLEGTR